MEGVTQEGSHKHDKMGDYCTWYHSTHCRTAPHLNYLHSHCLHHRQMGWVYSAHFCTWIQILSTLGLLKTVWLNICFFLTWFLSISSGENISLYLDAWMSGANTPNCIKMYKQSQACGITSAVTSRQKWKTEKLSQLTNSIFWRGLKMLREALLALLLYTNNLSKQSGRTLQNLRAREEQAVYIRQLKLTAVARFIRSIVTVILVVTDPTRRDTVTIITLEPGVLLRTDLTWRTRCQQTTNKHSANISYHLSCFIWFPKCFILALFRGSDRHYIIWICHAVTNVIQYPL